MATNSFPERGHSPPSAAVRTLSLRQEPAATAIARAPIVDEPAQRPGSALSVKCEVWEELIVLSLAGN